MGLKMQGAVKTNAITGVILGLAVALFCSQVALAETMYRWVDDEGRVHYGDRANKQAETVEVKTPARQRNSLEDQHQQQVNQDWFEQERQRRAEEAQAAKKIRVKKQKQLAKEQASCNKAQDKRDRAKAELKARKRAGVTPKYESKLKLRLESLEHKVAQSC